MACSFCEVVAGRMPAFVVADEPAGVAFLDIRPVFKGHTLVVPREHIRTFADLPVEQVGEYFAFVQRIEAAVREGLGSQGTFVAMNNVVSQSVPHLHTHVVPRTKGDGLRGFFWPRTKYASDEEAESFAADVRKALA
jgi:histidine triad (HIT) family protein